MFITRIKRASRRHSPAVIAATVASIVAAGGFAYAAIPGLDGAIKGCYALTSKTNAGVPYSKGDTRIVDSSEACRSYEQAISWSQRGPQGPQGPAGPQGEPGPFPDALPSGKTLRGRWITQGDSEHIDQDRISFVFTLAAAPEAHAVGIGDTHPDCPRSNDGLLTPTPGHLCVTVTATLGPPGPTSLLNPMRWGADIVTSPGSASVWYAAGDWAVTSP